MNRKNRNHQNRMAVIKENLLKISWAWMMALFMSSITPAMGSPQAAESERRHLAASDEVKDREMELAATRLYDGALRYYRDGLYWKAARELITILDFYPAFSKIDGVLIHLGEALDNMQMYNSASRMFRYLATKYPESRHLSQALHGLQRASYHAGDFEESLKIYGGLIGRLPDQETMDGAHYYAGQALFQAQNYDSTVVALGKIQPRSRHYDHGLYTTGLALLKKKASMSRFTRFGSY